MSQYQQIEKVIRIPLISDKNYKKIQTDQMNQTIGILIPIKNSNNPVLRIIYLIFTKLKIIKVQRKLSQIKLKIDSTYGVFPNEINPLVIYELSSQAENYADKNILPKLQMTLNGRLRKIIKQVIKFHPSLGCIIIVISK